MPILLGSAIGQPVSGNLYLLEYTKKIFLKCSLGS